ncbi:glycoside hydrolase superfamily, partial [Tribonema minus]
DYWNTVKPALDKVDDVVLVVQFDTYDYTNLQEIGDGRYDASLNQFIDAWKDDGNRRLSIRPMHEFNGDWYPWGTFRGGGNSKDNFKRAFQHVAGVFKRRGANVKMQLAYNCDSAQNDGSPFADWYPGDDVVDIILCSAYNRSGLEGHGWESFDEVFGGGYDRMASIPGNKPLGLGETGSTDWGGDKPAWISDAFNQLVYKYTRVQECHWLLENKEGDWDLNTDGDVWAFGDGMRKFEF